MKKRVNACFKWFLAVALAIGMIPAAPFGNAWSAVVETPLFQDDFEGSASLWDGTAWAKETDGVRASTVGKLASTGNYPTVRAKPGAWQNYAATNGDYTFRFAAKYADAAAGSPKYFRAFFRYDAASAAAPNHYYFEFRQGGSMVYFGQYANGVDQRIGSGYTLADKLPDFSFSVWHDYAIRAKGDTFRLTIDGVFIAEVSGVGSHPQGTVGFGLKNASIWVDDVRVIAESQIDAEPPVIVHTPPAYVDAGQPLTVSAAIMDDSPVTASVYYAYNDAPLNGGYPMAATVTGSTYGYTFDIPGIASGTIRYAIRAVDAGGLESWSPASGAYTVPVRQPPYTITHVPPASTYYNTDLSGTFAIGEASPGVTVTAAVYYRYGTEDYRVTDAVYAADGSYAFTIPGNNRSSSTGYYIDVRDSSGRSGRYPAGGGEVTVAVKPFTRFFDSFESTPAGSLPPDWSPRGFQPNIAVYNDGGNHVLRFANTVDGNNWSLKFVNPIYRNIDNFKIRFRAKYKVVNPNPNSSYNLWRLSYRASDASSNTMEWGSHNTKYLLFKRTALGSTQTGSYYRAVPDEWHTYELEAAGYTHRLYMDGIKVMEADDASADAPLKGFLQWTTVNGLELLIDDFEILPVSVPYVYYAEPAGSAVGIYESGEPVGLRLRLQAGNAPAVFKVSYQVSRADGDRAVVRTGEQSYAVAAYDSRDEVMPIVPLLSEPGTYDVASSLEVNGVAVPDKARTMRIAVLRQAAPVRHVDLDMESKFGFNVGYDLAWSRDALESVRKMGVRHSRQSFAWGDVDSGTGTYHYTLYDAIFGGLTAQGIHPIPMLGIAFNGDYDSGVVDNRTGLDALRRFTADMAAHYKGSVSLWEMPNEPELEIRPYIPQEMVQLQKYAYLGLKQGNFDASLLAGDHTSGVLGVLPGELELGSYNYSDGFSYHRYTYGLMPDGFDQKQTDGVKNLLNTYGAWKDLYITESGWPTALNGYPSVTQEVQRDYAVRGFLIDLITDQVMTLEHFQWKDSGFDPNFYNTNFGVTDGSGRPKLAYAALNQLMTALGDARYVGKILTGDDTVEGHMFVNGTEPVAVFWKKVNYGSMQPGEETPSNIGIPVSGATVTAADVNGKESVVAAEQGTVRLAVYGSPVYVKGAGWPLVFSSAASLLAEKQGDVTDKLEALRTVANGSQVDADLAELNRIHVGLAAALAEPQASVRSAGIEEAVKGLYGLLGTVAHQSAAGTIDRTKSSVATEALYNDAEAAARILIGAKLAEAGGTAAAADYGSALETARSQYTAKKGDYGLMPVATSAVMRANRYARMTDRALTEGRMADGYAYNLMAREFAKAIPAMVEAEPVLHADILMSASPLNGDVEAGGGKSVTVSLTNRTGQTHTAAVRLEVPEGWEAAQTGSALQTFTLGPNGAADPVFTIQAPADAPRGVYYAGLALDIDGVPSDRVRVRLTVTDAIQARIMPVTVPVQDLNTVTVRLTGTSRDPKTGIVTLHGPDGQALQPAVTGGDRFSIVYGQTVDLVFVWTYHTNRAFNEYVNSLEVTDTGLNRTIYKDTAVPLDFNIVQKTSASLAVDGSFGDWIDAFPIHLRGPERNYTEVYQPDNLDAVVYLKWDDQNLYLAADVTDDIHKAAEPPNGIWKNDSIQVAVDPLNDKGGTYKSDDVDFGLALNDFGEQIGFVFVAQPPNETGVITNQIQYKIVRDNERHKTRYEVQIPGNSIVDALQSRLQEGSAIGFNLIVADSDLQDGRQNYTGWTKGIAESKNPGLYDSFTFVDVPFELPDTVPPQITMPQISSVSQLEAVHLSVGFTDDSGTVAASSVTLDGQPIANPADLPPLSLAPGSHTLTASATDQTGNTSEQSLTFNVTLTLDELDDVLKLGAKNGWVKEDGTLQSLLTKVASIVRDRDNGKYPLDYSSLLQKIVTMDGINLTHAFAQLLKVDIRYLEYNESSTARP